MSNHTLLRLANASNNYDAYERQKQADQIAALKAQDAARASERDRWKFEQEKKAQDVQLEADALLTNNDVALAKASTPMTPQTSNKVSPALADAQPLSAQTAQQPTQAAQNTPTSDSGSLIGADGSATPLSPNGLPPMAGVTVGVATAPNKPNYTSASQMNQAKLDAFKAANPQKSDVIAAAQAKIDAMKQVESTKEHQDFTSQANNALSAFAASGGMNTDVLTNLATKYFPDGHDYKLGRNDQDGTYTLLQVDSGRSMKFDNYDKVGEYFSQILHPDTYIEAVQKGKAKGLEKSAQLPSEIALENAKTSGDIRKSDATGVTAKNQAEVWKTNAEAGKARAEANNVGKGAKDGNTRPLVNDGVKQLDAAYGVRRDPLTEMLDPDSIKDKAGYYRDSAELERRVNAGEPPMSVANDLASRAMAKNKLSEASMKPKNKVTVSGW